LTHKGKYAGAYIPDLILLDTDISNHSGLKLLDIINNSREFNGIPVEVKSYHNKFYIVIRKPIGYDKLSNIFKKYSLY